MYLKTIFDLQILHSLLNYILPQFYNWMDKKLQCLHEYDKTCVHVLHNHYVIEKKKQKTHSYTMKN